jgi:hypothetical protein
MQGAGCVVDWQDIPITYVPGAVLLHRIQGQKDCCEDG